MAQKGAPKGNQFWKARSKHGPNPKFDDPETLWDACCEYFEWVDANPLKEQKPVQGRKMTFNKMRAMTLGGLYIFLDITENTWASYRENDNLKAVCAKVDNIIRTQKFEGAAADLLNGNIIARDLGLKDKSEQDVNITPFAVSGEPEEDADEWLSNHKPQ